ncbi:MAG: hypothetical protein HC849_22450, partial [Oscillatoriales cyanobacterium RU_3_3]|nr:hypothetical protein [Oscillatoriales cyanobacterium RU_3_3]
MNNEGRRKKEEGRRKKEEGRRKREEGRGRELPNCQLSTVNSQSIASGGR